MDTFIVTVAESGRKEKRLQVSTKFSLDVENDRTGAGRDGRTSLEGLKSQAQTEKRENHFPLLADRKQDWQPCQVDAQPVCHISRELKG